MFSGTCVCDFGVNCPFFKVKECLNSMTWKRHVYKTNLCCVVLCVCSGDTGALCEDMKDFAHDYIDYSSMAKQLIPEINTVQHWSKIIETKYVLFVLVLTCLQYVRIDV